MALRWASKAQNKMKHYIKWLPNDQKLMPKGCSHLSIFDFGYDQCPNVERAFLTLNELCQWILMLVSQLANAVTKDMSQSPWPCHVLQNDRRTAQTNSQFWTAPCSLLFSICAIQHSLLWIWDCKVTGFSKCVFIMQWFLQIFQFEFDVLKCLPIKNKLFLDFLILCARKTIFCKNCSKRVHPITACIVAPCSANPNGINALHLQWLACHCLNHCPCIL